MGICLGRPETENARSYIEVGKGSYVGKEVEAIVPKVAEGDGKIQRQDDIYRPSTGLPYQTRVSGPFVPPCEDGRLATLKALKLNDMTVEAPPDPEIENILKLISSIFAAPSCLVALLDDRRVFIREARGIFQRGDFPWRSSICAWTMASQQDQIMVIPDTTKDARFAENVFVKAENGVRFYCGAPLIASNGHRLGTLCFADDKPREFDAAQASILGNFAEMVVRHVEKDIALQLMSNDNETLSHAYKNLKRTIDCFDHCVVLLDTSKPGWKIMHTNSAWEKATGCHREGIQDTSLTEVMETMSGSLPSRLHQEMVATGKVITIDNVRIKATWLAAGGAHSRQSLDSAAGAKSSGSRARRLVLKLRPAGSSAMDDSALNLAVPSWMVNSKNISGPGAGTASTLYFMTIESADAIHSRMSLSSSRTGSSLTSPVQGLNLGQLLGSGSFGSVYAGHWFGTPVAIKVIDQDLKALEAAGAQMEAVLGSELRHPHIVATLTYAVHANGNSSNPVSTTFTDDTAREFGPGPAKYSGYQASVHISESPDVTPSFQARVLDSASVTEAGFPARAAAAGIADTAAGVQSPPTADAPNTATAVPVSGADLAKTSSTAVPVAVALGKPLASGSGAPVDSTNVQVSVDSCSNSGRRSRFGSSAASSAAISSGQLSIPLNNNQASPAMHHALFSVMEVPADSSIGNKNFMSYNSDMDMDAGNTYACLAADMGLSLPQPVVHTTKQQTWIVLEFCDKGTLQDAVDRGWLNVPNVSPPMINMSAVASTACEVASALLYLHSHGVVHGDLSAWNVLLTTSGAAAMAGGRGFIAKVADFGLSRSLDITTRIQTRTYGTITHQPPETLLDGMVSRETDTYSLGVLMWQMYTGSRPWAGMSHAQIIMAVASRASHLTFPPDTPADYAALAYACLHYDASARPTMASVCATLECMKIKYAQDVSNVSRSL